jgi:hypothetical protein
MEAEMEEAGVPAGVEVDVVLPVELVMEVRVVVVLGALEPPLDRITYHATPAIAAMTTTAMIA